MTIEEKDVEHVAWLSRIALTPEERRLAAKELSSIIGLFSQLDAVEEDAEPTYHVLPVSNVFREDLAGECLAVDEALANAPRREGDYFRGPRIV